MVCVRRRLGRRKWDWPVVPTDGGFYGERAITRAEIATIFARYAELEGKIVTDGDLSAYTDVADVADWAADGMRVAVGSGIIGGSRGTCWIPTAPPCAPNWPPSL